MLALETRAENESSSLGGALFPYRSPEETGVCQPVKPALSLERAKSRLDGLLATPWLFARGIFFFCRPISAEERRYLAGSDYSPNHGGFPGRFPIARRAASSRQVRKRSGRGCSRVRRTCPRKASLTIDCRKQ